MTELDLKQAKAHERLSFLNHLRDLFPKGLQLAVMVTGVLSLAGVIGECWVLSKLYDVDAIREQSIKERRQSAAELHQLKMEVDSALSNNNRNTHTLDQVSLKMAQAELRGVINKSSMDTLKYYQKQILHKLNLKP